MNCYTNLYIHTYIHKYLTIFHKKFLKIYLFFRPNKTNSNKKFSWKPIFLTIQKKKDCCLWPVGCRCCYWNFYLFYLRVFLFCLCVFLYWKCQTAEDFPIAIITANSEWKWKNSITKFRVELFQQNFYNRKNVDIPAYFRNTTDIEICL